MSVCVSVSLYVSGTILRSKSPLLPGQESESQGSMSIRSHFSVLLLTLGCPFPHPPAAQSKGEC